MLISVELMLLRKKLILQIEVCRSTFVFYHFGVVLIMMGGGNTSGIDDSLPIIEMTF